MDTEFNLSFSNDSRFDIDVEQKESLFDADFDSPQKFDMSLDDGEELFDVEMQSNTHEFNADFGEKKEVIYADRVTSVNGMIGDVLIPVPENVSELENDTGYITETGMESLTNQEIEALLT